MFYAEEYYPIKITERDVILDVGANIGMSVLYFYKKGARNIIAIEPEPRNFELLKLNILSNKLHSIKLLNLAISDEPGTLSFNDTGGTATAYKSNDHSGIEADTLDNVLTKLGNPDISILKMDIEGFEVKALKNFQRHESIKQVIIETHSKELTNEIIHILKEWGLTVRDVSRIKRGKVLKNIFGHFIAFISAEKKNQYSTIKQSLKYLVKKGNSPVAADNNFSEQRVLYAFKQ
ncbi:MAG: FkbM family methyltransferase [Candidatus Aenigmatarchaeota archaeon]